MKRALWLVVAIANLALLAQQAPPRDVAGRATGSAEISGTVQVRESGSPILPYAQVGVMGIDSGLIRITSADIQGRYRIQGLPAGKYVAAAFKEPYIGMMFGATRPGRAGTAIALAQGERRDDITISVVRGGVITGTIHEEDGRPAAGMPVMLQAAGGEAAPMMQQMMSMAFQSVQITDDRGIYRFAGVMPGEYLVVVNRPERRDPDARKVTDADIEAAVREMNQPRAPVAATGASPAATAEPARPGTLIGTGSEPAAPSFPQASGPMAGLAAMMMAGAVGPGGYAPVFYPGAVDPAEAQSVRVASGEERSGVDFTAHAVLTAQLSGMVTDPAGQPVSNVSVRLRHAGQGENLMRSMMSMANAPRINKDGTFTLVNVAPGRYAIEARTGSSAGFAAMLPNFGTTTPPGQPPLFASVDVVVSAGQSLTGIELRLQAAARVTGTLRFNATRLDRPADASQAMVVLMPVAAADPFMAALAGNSRVQADGTFAIDGVIPGRYVLNASLVTPDAMLEWMPESVIAGGRNVSDLPIEVKADGLSSVQITLTDRQQELSGRLQDATGRPASAFSILLFPTDRTYWLQGSRRVLMTRPATDGSFVFRAPLAPPPGEYFLAALTDLGPEEQYKTAVLEEVAKAAFKISIAPGEKKVQDIRIAR